MANHKKNPPEKESVRPNKTKRVLILLIMLIVLAGAGLGYYFFFYKNHEKASSVVVENETAAFQEQVAKLMNDFLGQVKWTSINDTGDITPYVLPAVKNEIQAKLFPDGWTDLPGTIIEPAKVTDENKATVAIIFPLLSPYGQKLMTNTYTVSRTTGQWLISGLTDQVIKDHGITTWPVNQDTKNLGDTQTNIRDHRDSEYLDPLKTVKQAASANGYTAGDQFELITDTYNWVPAVGTYQSAVKTTHDNQVFYVLLTQPFRKGYWGVWSIESITRDKPNI